MPESQPLSFRGDKESKRRYYEANREKIIKRVAEWRKSNPEKLRAQRKRDNIRQRENKRRWAKEHTEKRATSCKQYRLANPYRARAWAKKANIKKRSTPRGKLNNSMAEGIRQSLTNGSKFGRHWEGLVGYTVDQLRAHLEKQFLPGMSWGNYGKLGWHVDHKIPLAAFNFQTPEDIDFRRCWALNNLQPMWGIPNIKKGANIDRPFQPALLLAGVG
jgi:hypothetical protein